MAIRSRDFIGVAEGIRSHELSTKGKIEYLKRRISDLSEIRSSLYEQISYIEAAIAAVYENTNEDGEPDYDLIYSLESQKVLAENRLFEAELNLNSTSSKLEQSENELEAIIEEKAQTVFEIQERARKTSQNIVLAGGMYGAYAGVGSSLQNSMQISLSSLSQAANILDGSITRTSAGGMNNSSVGSRNFASSNASSMMKGGSSTGNSSAFTCGTDGDGSIENGSQASQFITEQGECTTPANIAKFHSVQNTINPQKSQNFSTEQDSNTYTATIFSDSNKGSKPKVGLGGNTTAKDWDGKTSTLAKHSPIEIPSDATVKIQNKVGGYDQITYKWSDGTYTYKARWHTPTPNAPSGSNNSWVIEQITPGTPMGQLRIERVYTPGINGDWTPMWKWKDAVDAYNKGTMTSLQNDIMKAGHIPAP